MLLPLLVTLGACGVEQALDRMDHEADERQCRDFGFRPGTDTFANCMQQQEAQRREEIQRSLDRQAKEDAARKARKR